MSVGAVGAFGAPSRNITRVPAHIGRNFHSHRILQLSGGSTRVYMHAGRAPWHSQRARWRIYRPHERLELGIDVGGRVHRHRARWHVRIAPTPPTPLPPHRRTIVLIFRISIAPGEKALHNTARECGIIIKIYTYIYNTYHTDPTPKSGWRPRARIHLCICDGSERSGNCSL